MASVLLAGGGTAGHVNPMLATAAELRARGHEVAALGTAEGLEADLVPRAGLALHPVPRVPFPRRISSAWVKFPANLRAAIRAAEAAIDASGADAVVGFGGYVSTPAYLAARRRRLPIIVHEANMRPGLANRLAARLGARIAITFPDTPLKGGVLTGLPLRADIAELAATLADAEQGAQARRVARGAWSFPEDAPVLLVTGGSLGAASLNAATVGAVGLLVERGIHVIHLTGRGKAEAALAARASLPVELQARYRVEEYAHDMASAFAAADAVICRSGAATVSEITALGIPAVYVPLPHGNGEQALNARQAVDAGAAALVPDAELSPGAVVEWATRFIQDAAARRAAVLASASIGIRDGAARLADIIEEEIA